MTNGISITVRVPVEVISSIDADSSEGEDEDYCIESQNHYSWNCKNFITTEAVAMVHPA